MIRRMTVHEHYLLKGVTLTLEPLTILIGHNGAGKSTLMGMLEHMAEAWRVPAMAMDLPLGSAAELDVGHPSQVFAAAHPDVNQMHRGFVRVGDGLVANVREWADVADTNVPPLSAVIGLQIRSDRVRQPALKQATYNSPSPDGSGLAGFVAGLKLGTDDERFVSWNENVRQVVPSIDKIGVDASSADSYRLEARLVTGKRIPANQLSDGTLVAMALLAALEATGDRSTLMLIDDLDQGLHPKAQWDLMACIRRIQQRMPALQIVATTHSPFLLDACTSEEIRMVALGEDGYSRVKPFGAHKDWSGLQGALSPGEFWSSVGEAWVAKD